MIRLRCIVLLICMYYTFARSGSLGSSEGSRVLLINGTSNNTPRRPPAQFGASCAQNNECQSKSCSPLYQTCAEVGCSGTCQSNFKTFCWDDLCYRQQPIGGRCRVNSDCESSKCYFGYCSTLAPPTCQFCVNCPSSCPFGTYCDDVKPTGVDSGTGYCYSALPVGTPCQSSTQCLSTFCDSSKRCAVPANPFLCSLCSLAHYCDATTDSKCVPKKPDGSHCSYGYQCETGYCNTHFKKCTMSPGTNCTGSNDTTCPMGQYCESASGGWTCNLLRENYQTCVKSPECRSNYCSSYLRMCTTAPGALCLNSSTCPRGQYCAWGSPSWKCVQRKFESSACTSDDECYSLWCRSNLCAAAPAPSKVTSRRTLQRTASGHVYNTVHRIWP